MVYSGIVGSYDLSRLNIFNIAFLLHFHIANAYEEYK